MRNKRKSRTTKACNSTVEMMEQRVLLSTVPAGSLDPGFGKDGEVTISSTSQDSTTAVAVQSNGDVIEVGGNTATRLLPNGAVDSTFGTAGQVTLTGAAFQINIHANGTILFGGTMLEQLTATGAVDTSFGTNGFVQLPAGTESVAQGADGSIYAVNNASLYAYNADGSVKTAFGNGGMVSLGANYVTNIYSSALAIDPQGRIDVGLGAATIDPQGYGYAGYIIERFETNGTVDTSFGAAGFSPGQGNYGVPDYTSIVVAQDGTIYQSGNDGYYDGPTVITNLYAVSSTGALDAQSISDGVYQGGISSLSLQTDGKLLAVGFTYTDSEQNETAIYVDRFEPASTTSNSGKDLSFGGPYSYGSSGSDIGESIVQAPDGDLIIAGKTDSGFTVTAIGAGLVSNSSAHLTGTPDGTAGSYKSDGSVGSNAFDGNLATYFDAPTATGSWTGLNLGTPAVVNQISFAPRNGYAYRMVGGMFQGSNTADFSSGVSTLYTITTEPANGTYTTVPVSNTSSFEYVRYLGPANGDCNVAEVQFIGSASNTGPATLQHDGTLAVNGTNGADNIAVNFDQFASPPSIDVTVNGVEQIFNWASVNSVVINSMGGNDTVNVQGSNGQTDLLDIRPVSVISGDGNDTFYTNLVTDDSNQDFASINIAAGNGIDSFEIDGSGEDATVVAGNGNDSFVTNIYGLRSLTADITAGNGNNTLTTGTSGGQGNQNITFNAGIGQDTIFNSDENDYDTGTLGGQAYSIGWQQEALIGKVYADYNGDGKYEAGEPLVAGAQVTFQNSYDGTFGTTTNSTGNYNLPVYFNEVYPGTVNYGGGQTVNLTVGELESGANFALSQPLGGTNIGTSGSYQNNGNTVAKAFDGNLSTYFDGPTANGDYVGRDLGTPTVITAIAYAPRSGLASRMVGGTFQGSNSANFSNAVNLYTITTAPTAGVLTNEPITNTTAFRYVRYVGPAGSYGNVAEVQFFSVSTPTQYASLSSLGILTVTGTSGSDNIQVAITDQYPNENFNYDTVVVTVNGNVETFDANAVTGIIINTGDGNDTVSLTGGYVVDDQSSPAFDPTNDFATTINAGNGNDSISAGVYADLLYESPSDVIHLGSGTDNVMIYQDGNDTVYCGSGNDHVEGDASDGGGLYVFGGSGNDTVVGDGFTSDFFYGGTGTNTYYEGPDFDETTVDVNLNGPYFTNIQYYYADDGAENLTVEAGPTTRQIVMDDLNNVTITGSSGDEFIQVEANHVVIDAGSGNTTIAVQADTSATVNGGSGNDTIDDNSIFAGSPITINGGGGTNTAYTNPGDTVTNIQFLNPKAVPLTGTLLATAGSYQNDGNTAAKAFDGNLSDYFDGPTANGNYVGIDLGSGRLISAVSYAPRVGFGQRMVGGLFQTSDSPDFSNPVDIATITAAPVSGQLTTIDLSLPTFARYIRYLSPDGSYGDVAEIQFLPPGPTTGPSKLSGTVIGTAGSYQNDGNTISKVFDGNLSNYFDGPTASGDWAGLDFGTPTVVTQVQYAPRAGFESRMIGGEIQASNTANFSSGVVTLYTITAKPTAGVFTVQSLNNSTAYRYYRYLGPANSYGDISELEFDG